VEARPEKNRRRRETTSDFISLETSALRDDATWNIDFTGIANTRCRSALWASGLSFTDAWFLVFVHKLFTLQESPSRRAA
jgi:hypothetical protein